MHAHRRTTSEDPKYVNKLRNELTDFEKMLHHQCSHNSCSTEETFQMLTKLNEQIQEHSGLAESQFTYINFGNAGSRSCMRER